MSISLVAPPLLLDDDPQAQERSRQEIIRSLAFGVLCAYGHLPVDNVFYGFGREREPIIVGVEVKRPDDMADSIVRSGRLVQQFRKAQEFGCSELYLVVQGEVRPSKVTGLVETRKWVHALGKYDWAPTSPELTYSHWENSLNTMEVQANIHVKHTLDPYTTAASIVAWYHWWQKPVDEHSSLDRFHTPVMVGASAIGKTPTFRRLVKEFEGVGWTRSDDFMRAYAGTGLSIREILGLGAKVWAKDVKGVGKVTAEKMEVELNQPLEYR